MFLQEIGLPVSATATSKGPGLLHPPLELVSQTHYPLARITRGSQMARGGRTAMQPAGLSPSDSKTGTDDHW